MTLLPDVERELRRVASDSPAPRAPTRGVIRGIAHAMPVAFAVAAIAIAADFVVSLGHGGPAPVRMPARPPATPDPFSGAPHPSPGRFERSRYICPRIPRSRYLPADAGCVSVLRADVAGTGGDDLVLLYAVPRRPRSARDYVAGTWRYVLEVVDPAGRRQRLSIVGQPFVPAISSVGDVNRRPGAELFVALSTVEDGTQEIVVTDGPRGLEVAGPFLGVADDSADRAAFSCRTGRRPAIVERSATLVGPTITGRWRWRVVVWRWRGSSLRVASDRRSTRRGDPHLGPSGGGCGRELVRLG